jgi:hypothetical protein
MTIHILDGSYPVSLDVMYESNDIPSVLGIARGALQGANDPTIDAFDVLAANQRIDTMVELTIFRLNCGIAEVALSTLLSEANLQHGALSQEISGRRVFTDAPSRLAEQALRDAVWQKIFGNSDLVA